MAFADRARFYEIERVKYPSVTTILGVIDKSGPLMHWAANQERAAFTEAAQQMLAELEALVDDPAKRRDDFRRAVHGGLDTLVAATTGVKAMHKTSEKAKEIGTAAHALIEWHTRVLLGEKVGDPPANIPDAAVWSVESWKEWAASVDFTPLVIERPVYCPECGYAGSLDWIGKVSGVVSLGDYKTSKAIYPEAFLQNIAYRHGAEKQGMPTEQGIILRLPKTVDDPAFEAMVVPDTPHEDFLAALRLWRWQRRMDGKPVGGPLGGLA